MMFKAVDTPARIRITGNSNNLNRSCVMVDEDTPLHEAVRFGDLDAVCNFHYFSITKVTYIFN